MTDTTTPTGEPPRPKPGVAGPGMFRTAVEAAAGVLPDMPPATVEQVTLAVLRVALPLHETQHADALKAAHERAVHFELEAVKAAERAESVEKEVQRYRSFCGEALCGDVERDRDEYLRQNEQLRGEVQRLQAERAEARGALSVAAEMLDRFAADTPCTEGGDTCREHNYARKPCVHPLARQFVTAWRAIEAASAPQQPEFPAVRDLRADKELHAFRAHPLYEYATTQGPRKAWDHIDEPPEGNGWERNLDAGRNGWERFDYHEESYWRRLRSEVPQQPVQSEGVPDA
jgi:hypothetical protein